MSIQRQTIVIIEKDHAAREMYRRELAQEFDVFPCANIEDANQVLDQRTVDVVVWEPVQSGDKGWAFLHGIKANPRLAEISVIVCSTLEVRDVDVKNQLAACLVKPVVPSELFLAIHNVMENGFAK